LVMALGWAWGARGAPATASVRAVPTDWTAVVTGLDAARAHVFRTGAPGGLTAVYEDGSELLQDDAAALADLRTRHVTVRGLAHRLISVDGLAGTDDRVTLTVRQALSAYSLVDARGTVVERHTAGPVLKVAMVLVRTAAGWRVDEVRPA
ncbi:MAG: hypothetical protein JWO22_1792, partial [Frankiales bacterium]|nr:hypothetical protein [Frankiales bacterium]